MNKNLPPRFQGSTVQPGVTQVPATPSGNVIATVGDLGTVKPAFQASNDRRRLNRLRIRFTNASGAAYTNLPVFLGFLGLDPNFDLDAAFPSLGVSMSEVNTTLAVGSYTFDIRSSKNGSYGVVSGRIATSGFKFNDLEIRTNDRENLDGNRLRRWALDASFNTHQTQYWELDSEFDPNTVPTVVKAKVSEFDILLINTQECVLLDRLKQGTYIEFDFGVPFMADSAFFTQVQS